MIRVWEISVCSLDFPPLISSLGTTVVISGLSGRPKMGATATLQYYIGFYTRLTCVHVEPAQSTPSIAPPLRVRSIPLRDLPLLDSNTALYSDFEHFCHVVRPKPRFVFFQETRGEAQSSLSMSLAHSSTTVQYQYIGVTSGDEKVTEKVTSYSSTGTITTVLLY